MRVRAASVSVLSLAVVAALAGCGSDSDAAAPATTSDPCALLGPAEVGVFSSNPDAEPQAGNDKISSSCAWEGADKTVLTVTLQNTKTDPSRFRPESKLTLAGIDAFADGSVGDFCTAYVPAPNEDKTLMLLATPDTPTAQANPLSDGETWCQRAEPALMGAVQKLGWA
ncbi:hypothetical protein [Rhodococcus sp. HNM0569]|uniref:hypothetical protein n=1 Tax=Rhodococcus sp. HNM0569 TaxID=2716340 RepID=UPI00146BA8BD|nr:hypothetical protein [Rhodococcus sp. HNM0569]NLU83605.1 hypothetical protein [Rhodococcus sp. HNM0569]